MRFDHMAHDALTVSPLNMRFRRNKAEPDVSDILPSIRKRGVLLPLIVRALAEPGRFEILAGWRRHLAAGVVRAEREGELDPLPVAIVEPGDDAEAIELSLLENFARLDPDEMTQHETFVDLVKAGRSLDDIAETFGITPLTVKRRLALGNLLPAIRDAYRADEIDAETVRHLTLASSAQQKKWLKLFRSEDEYAPTGRQLKAWLFGGQQIATAAALFPLESYKGKVVTDLFGEGGYFADPDAFWKAQSQALAEKREALIADGWAGVEVLEPGKYFASYEHAKASKDEGGRVYVAVRHDGSVEFHEGWLTTKEAKQVRRRREAEARGEEPDAEPVAEGKARSEVTGVLANYLGLHRLAAVRLAVVSNPGVALRLMVAHAVASAGQWQVKPDPLQAQGKAIEESVAGSPAALAFADERRAVLALLGQPEDRASVAQGSWSDDNTVIVFALLLALDDADVFRVLAFVMAETLAAGSAIAEAAGVKLAVDPAAVGWQADEAFLDLLRDRAVVNAMLAEVAGDTVAKGNLTEKLKVQKGIIRDFVLGANGRPRTPWLPGYMAFPARAYTDAGGVPPVERWERVAAWLEPDAGEPADASDAPREPDGTVPASPDAPEVEEDRVELPAFLVADGHKPNGAAVLN